MINKLTLFNFTNFNVIQFVPARATAIVLKTFW